MKACTYCGRENEDSARYCIECGTEWPVPADESESASPQEIIPVFINLEEVDRAFELEHGFSHPNWERIRKKLEATVDPADIDFAWYGVVHQWLDRLRHDLGGEYRITRYEHFILLAATEQSIAANLLRFAERAHGIIRANLGELAWKATGLRAIIVFSDEDDYYAYIARFYHGTQLPRSAAVHINTGYTHVALTFRSEPEARHSIAHELSHGCLPHLPVPRWLDEGVAETLRRMIGGPQPGAGEGSVSAYWGAVSGWTPPLMWHELAERHHNFWNETNIQSFWAGTSFYGPQEEQELSYSLAEVLVHLLSGDHDAFITFISRAHFDDAAQTAALDVLGRNLGDVVAEFLGPGNWRPYRRAIVDCWKAAEWAGKKDKDSSQDK